MSGQLLSLNSTSTKESSNQNLLFIKISHEIEKPDNSEIGSGFSTANQSPFTSNKMINSHLQIDKQTKINYQFCKMNYDLNHENEKEENLSISEQLISVKSKNEFSNIDLKNIFEDTFSKEDEEKNTSYLEYCLSLINSLQEFFESTLYNKMLKETLENSVKNIKRIVKKEDNLLSKDILVLDMDETLLHTDSPAKFDCHYDFLINLDDEIMGINLRPGIYEFLKDSSKLYDLVLYSAGKRDYVEEIVSKIDIFKYFSMILCFDETIQILNQIFLKDLRIIKYFDFIRQNMEYSFLVDQEASSTVSNSNKNILQNFLNEEEFLLYFENSNSIKFYEKEIIIADNNIFSFSNNLDNGILIEDYYYDKEDSELEKLNILVQNIANEKRENGTLLKTQIKQIFNYSCFINESNMSS